MAQTKEKLRTKYKAIRLGMGPRTIEEDSLTICRKLFREIDWGKVKTISVYEPIKDLNEVDILPFIEAVEYKYPKVKIRQLGKSKTQKIPKRKFDLIIVPCLAFDKQNYRLGWGGGFYDRFLAAQPQATAIGVCFQNGFVIRGLPNELHDFSLNKIITEV
jgi:5-formyltetrahydrofolate cyclo-ligase